MRTPSLSDPITPQEATPPQAIIHCHAPDATEPPSSVGQASRLSSAQRAEHAPCPGIPGTPGSPSSSKLLASSTPTATPATPAPHALPRQCEPVTQGISWPRGKVKDASELVLFDPLGSRVPLQTCVLDKWADGSARWTLLDFQASPGDYVVKVCDGPKHRKLPLTGPGHPGIILQKHHGPAAGSPCLAGVTVDTGLLRATVQVGNLFPFAFLQAAGNEPMAYATSGLVVEDQHGTAWQTQIDAIEVEHAGPLRATLQVRGWLTDKTRKRLAITCQFHFYAQSAAVGMNLTLTNPRKATHPGGKWGMGGRYSVYLREVSLKLKLNQTNANALDPASAQPTYACTVDPKQAMLPCEGPIALYQDSSGKPHWQSRNHVNRHGNVPVSFRGYRLKQGQVKRQDHHATPIVAMESQGRYLAAAMHKFWQNFPKAIEANEQGITLSLFPKQFADVHEIQGGEQKTHRFHLAFGRDTVCKHAGFAWTTSPMHVHVDPAWTAYTQAIAYLSAKQDDGHVIYGQLVNSAIEGSDTFTHKRDVIDEYGWRHFGDVYADHEAALHKGDEPLISHYNNQYDTLAGLIYQFLRSGDMRWSHLIDELAEHVIDIDIYHTQDDKSAYNGGMFWHTCHYVEADTAGHRTYPLGKKTPGGGPSGGHLYTTGLMLHYFLTGNTASRDAAVGLGEYVIHADDGTKTVFRFLDQGYTGHVSQSGFQDHHGPGRASANAINALLDAYRLTGKKRFCQKAEALIRRSVHPADNLQTLELDNIEQKWFYTMFLQVLGKYLDDKIQRDELDHMYAYAQAVLLHYAQWMADNESPYLERADQLEYPTETWAAQDMRKSEVFKYAYKHAVGQQRALFWQQARYYFNDATKRLNTKATKTLCRPVVLMLVQGFAQAWFEQHAHTQARQIPHKAKAFGSPTIFITQKQRIKKRIKKLSPANWAAL